MASTTTYLIDNTGNITHTWSSSYYPGAAVWWLGNGTILRAILVGPGPAGAGGGVEKITWDGTVIWDFRYNTDGHLSHHDVKSLPNGNVLMIAWETKTYTDIIKAGRNPNYDPYQDLLVDHIIEVKPTGPSSGDIVWEWHAWDHLIQDYDSSKDNYGVVEDHPELIDFNFGNKKSDWLHTNAVDYNKKLDQIILSVSSFNEIWIIDHSTTTEEAAGHTGGNSGKGGDILYRWGNPQAYRIGDESDRKLFFQHDAQWIDAGYPGEGNILIFNNGAGRPSTDYSSVDEIIPPVDTAGNYFLEPGFAYGPKEPEWSYTRDTPESFFASYLSGAQRLLDGDTLICNGETGEIFEVTPEKITVWEYTNKYPNQLENILFKVVYIPVEEPPVSNISDLDCYGSLRWSDVKPGKTVTDSFNVENVGDPNSLLDWEIDSYPEWGTWTFTPMSGKDLTLEDGSVTVQVSVVAPYESNEDFSGEVKIVNSENSSDYEIIQVLLSTPNNRDLRNSEILQLIKKVLGNIFHFYIHR